MYIRISCGGFLINILKCGRMKICKINADFERYDSGQIDYDVCAQTHEFDEYALLIDFEGTSQAPIGAPALSAKNWLACWETLSCVIWHYALYCNG